MTKIGVCESCGVPKLISSVFSWDDNGIISISYSPGARMVFYESENIDNIFRGVEELIGLSIEHIVMERKRRDTRRFMARVLAKEIETLASIIGEGHRGRLSSVDPERRQ